MHCKKSHCLQAKELVYLINNSHCPLLVIDLSKIPVAHQQFVRHRGNDVDKENAEILIGLHLLCENQD